MIDVLVWARLPLPGQPLVKPQKEKGGLKVLELANLQALKEQP